VHIGHDLIAERVIAEFRAPYWANDRKKR
jgi:hypothetical protein